MSIPAMIVAFVVSTVGLSLFVFGKRQRRIPQYAAGILLMAAPFVVPDPVWAAVAAVLMLLAMRVAISYGV